MFLDSYWADGMAEVEERVSGGRPGGKAEVEAGKLRGPETGAGNKAAMGPIRVSWIAAFISNIACLQFIFIQLLHCFYTFFYKATTYTHPSQSPV